MKMLSSVLCAIAVAAVTATVASTQDAPPAGNGSLTAPISTFKSEEYLKANQD
jgi:hypothetical protein